MEYACTVWDPYTETNIDRLVMVQRGAARPIVGDYRGNSSPSATMKELDREVLAERRIFRILSSGTHLPMGQLGPGPEVP